ncbi:glycerol-3-phosphate 1-O-acyltransferase PlsY [Sphingomonas sp. LHG3406-1]|uniref:glycerol-3-phosphate 1-O-acyltransferase PlsY n=1 Tax=Sphingomonas sp. LHG3406-1 TaxID=2804617 RepID=UPI00262C8D7C|nr:glycerol-3-phosphate 1-O-acyltransferase PlsY [Sphingomonas sp. LHG3406-1]
MSQGLLLALALGYALGSIPFGLILTRLTGRGDIRTIGSGNIGATNVLRTGSKGLAAATLVLDALKGTAAVLIAQRFLPGYEIAAAGGAMIGHLYPVWLKFRGGKGVATYLGVLIPLFPPAAALYAGLWIAFLLLVRISSVAGMTAALSAPLLAAFRDRSDLLPLLAGLSVLVIWKHKENIVRLRAGTEPRVGRSRA